MLSSERSLTFNSLRTTTTQKHLFQNGFHMTYATEGLKALLLDAFLPQKQMIAQASALFCQLYCYWSELEENWPTKL